MPHRDHQNVLTCFHSRLVLPGNTSLLYAIIPTSDSGDGKLCSRSLQWGCRYFRGVVLGMGYKALPRSTRTTWSPSLVFGPCTLMLSRILCERVVGSAGYLFATIILKTKAVRLLTLNTDIILRQLGL